MDKKKVGCEKWQAVAHVQLRRPEVLNAIDDDVCRELTETVRALEADGETKVVVLSGWGEKAFCAGADLKRMRALSGASLRRFIEATWVPLETLACSPLISIAALHGYALGGGAELALACDIRIASRTLKFGFPEIELGSLPGSSGLQRLPEIVGHSKALEILTLGTRLDAETAQTLGLVNRVVDDDGSLLPSLFDMADGIAQRPYESLRYLKLAMRMNGRPDIAAAFHGLVSSVRQADPAYRSRTEDFRGKNGGSA